LVFFCSVSHGSVSVLFSFLPDSCCQRFSYGSRNGQFWKAKPLFYAQSVFPAEYPNIAPETRQSRQRESDPQPSDGIVRWVFVVHTRESSAAAFSLEIGQMCCVRVPTGQSRWRMILCVWSIEIYTQIYVTDILYTPLEDLILVFIEMIFMKWSVGMGAIHECHHYMMSFS